MAKETVTRIVCDGKNGRCGKVLNGTSDGILFLGSIRSVGERLLVDSNGWEMALCWSCFHVACPDDSVLTEVKDALNRSQSARDREPSYPSNYEYTPGDRPTGPLPPPELPRCVAVVAALCGVDP